MGNKAKIAVCILLLIAGAFILISFSPIKVEQWHMDRMTGSLRITNRSFYYLPLVGTYGGGETSRIETSPFHRDFYPDREVGPNWLVRDTYSTLNIWYPEPDYGMNLSMVGVEEQLLEGFRSKEEYFYQVKLSDNSDMPYFVHLYNSEDKFRKYIQKNIADGKLSREWFLNTACADIRNCPVTTFDIRGKQARILMSYDSDQDWEPPK